MPLVNGLSPQQIDLLLTKLRPDNNGLNGQEARALINSLLKAASGPLNPVQIFGLADTLFNTLAAPTGNIRSKKTEQICKRLLEGDNGANNGITPANLNTLVTTAVATITRDGLLTIVTNSTPVGTNNQQKIVSPAFFYSCSQQANFFAQVNGAVNGGCTLDQVIGIICQANASGIQAQHLNALLGYTPTVSSSQTNHRSARVRRFLREAEATNPNWNAVFQAIANFVNAGRAPFGAATAPFPDNQTGVDTPPGVGFPVNIVRNVHGYNVTIRVSNYRINYFCNAHVQAHFQFSNDWLARSPVISLWAPGTTRANVITMVTNAVNNGNLDAIVSDAADDPGHYTTTQVYNANSDAETGGTYYGNNNVFYLRHFHSVGVGGVNLSRDVLKAIRNLFN